MQATTSFSQFLLENWSTSNPRHYAGACAASAALALTYELLTCWGRSLAQARGSSSLGYRLVRSLYHTFLVAVSYLIMLIMMQYNAGLFLSVLAGALIGKCLAEPLLGMCGSSRATGVLSAATPVNYGALESSHSLPMNVRSVVSCTLALGSQATPLQLGNVERRLLTVDGVVSVTISRALRTAQVSYRASVLSADDLVAALRSEGISAVQQRQ